MDKQNFLKTWGIVVAAVTITFSSAIDVVNQIGGNGAGKQKITVALDADTTEHMKESFALTEKNNRMLIDLHRGSAPLDANMTPQWTALRASLDKTVAEMNELRRSIDRNSRQAERLGFELEDRLHRGPVDQGFVGPRLAEREETTVFQRIAAWFKP